MGQRGVTLAVPVCVFDVCLVDFCPTRLTLELEIRRCVV